MFKLSLALVLLLGALPNDVAASTGGLRKLVIEEPETTPPTAAPTKPPAPECEDDEDLFELELVLDAYPKETTWELINTCNDTRILSSQPYWKSEANSTKYYYKCIEKGTGLNFTIFDMYGDGLCCGYFVDGEYKLTLGDEVFEYDGQFHDSETTVLSECVAPTGAPTTDRTITMSPSEVSTASPTATEATGSPTAGASTGAPTGIITDSPTGSPTAGASTGSPTDIVTGSPTPGASTGSPTGTVTYSPTGSPTAGASTGMPTDIVTGSPTGSPTAGASTGTPTGIVTDSPTAGASTGSPTGIVTDSPTAGASTGSPTGTVTDSPTAGASTGSPTGVVTDSPTGSPTAGASTGTPTTDRFMPTVTDAPTGFTGAPTGSEIPTTGAPTSFCPAGFEVVQTCVQVPTLAPSTSMPSDVITGTPTVVATDSPTAGASTGAPTGIVTESPTGSPTAGASTGAPTDTVTGSPTAGASTGSPTGMITDSPSAGASTGSPSGIVTDSPTGTPTAGASTGAPTDITTGAPTEAVTLSPTTTCPEGESFLEIVIKLDEWPTETYWFAYSYECISPYNYNCQYTSFMKSPEYWKKEAGMEYTYSKCIPHGRTYFYIYDTYGDGMCCEYGQGGYKIYIDGILGLEGGDFGRRAYHMLTPGSDLSEEVSLLLADDNILPKELLSLPIANYTKPLP